MRINKLTTCVLLIFLFRLNSFSQSISLNNKELIQELRLQQLRGDSLINYSFTQRPINYDNSLKINYFSNLLSFSKGKGEIKLLPIAYDLNINTRHPYNRNNGSMIPNRGYQHLIDFGFYFKYGPLSVQLNPEHLYAENKKFDGFWEGHYDAIWAKRYLLWNTADIPERFGNKRHNKFLLGQSSLKLNFGKISFGLSNENLWWGPSTRNAIILSNHSRSFNHITINSCQPIETKIGDFEFQFVTGKLIQSGFTPPNIERTYGGQVLYVPKINQLSNTNDWRYFQGINVSYSPKFIDGLTLGFTRWTQMYSALIKGKYNWMNGNPTYFPLFKNLFRKNDSSSDLEEQTDQAAGIYFRWIWKDSNAEIYSEFAYNDSKQNIRDLLLDSDHARAITVGLQKFFPRNNLLFNWEWTQMEQTAGRLVRTAGSWYRHYNVYHGYTNYGEIMGSSIGPGSNSNYFSVSKVEDLYKIELGFEVIDQDNDFYYLAFEDSQDYRRMWKDYNLHLKYQKSYGDIQLAVNLILIKSLNYQWELTEKISDYYQPGRDVNNLHLSTKIIYHLPIK